MMMMMMTATTTSSTTQADYPLLLCDSLHFFPLAPLLFTCCCFIAACVKRTLLKSRSVLLGTTMDVNERTNERMNE